MEVRLCEYGCGQASIHQFDNGKWCCSYNVSQCSKIRKDTAERNKLRIYKPHTEETKRKLREIKKGQIPWNKGKTGVYSEETINQMSESSKKENLSDKTLQKMRDGHKGSVPWNKGKIEVYSEETINQMSESSKKENLSDETLQRMSDSAKGREPWNKGKTGVYSEETINNIRLNTRLTAIKIIQDKKGNGYQLIPNYNPEGCKLIDQYGKLNGYNFKHAENGGEFYIKELGYWVDGYDAKTNTVIEIDEARHFDSDGNLSERDIRRQNEITEFLNCDFIRLKAL